MDHGGLALHLIGVSPCIGTRPKILSVLQPARSVRPKSPSQADNSLPSGKKKPPNLGSTAWARSDWQRAE
jgi:hypothetical protein